MLDQRRAKEKGYITLREAAKISNYAPDYIGQLIRSGKIRGEQVYCNTAWVTTEEEVRAYLENKERIVTAHPLVTWYEAHGAVVLKYVLYTVITLLLIGILLLQYIFYVALDRSVSDTYLSTTVSKDTT